LFQKEGAMCKIKSKKLINGRLEDIDGCGFFLEINLKDILFKKYLLTNNHILNGNDIKLNKEIILEYKNEIKKITITGNRKVYTNEELDYTCIEIFDTENIKDYFKIDENLIEYSIENYKNKDIFILQYPKRNEISFSSGIILDTKDNKIIHNSSTNKGSSGSPIISRNSNNSIIGLHYGSNQDNSFNLSTNIISIFNHIKNYYNNNKNNYIIAEIEIKEEDINKKILIINSYEEVKRINSWKNKEDDYKYENEKEIKENCEIKINNKKFNFSFYCIFPQKGNYKIEYTFKHKLSKTCFMFYGCSSLTNINLSNFNTQNVINMHSMFYSCSSLTNINLSNFNTQNVTNMDSMFCDCSSLTNINLSNFNTQKGNNMSYMFYDCSSLTNVNLSNNFKTQNVINMLCMFCGCSSLTNINLSNFNTHNVKDMSNMFGFCSSLTNINLSNFILIMLLI